MRGLNADVVKEEELVSYLSGKDIADAEIAPANDRIRVLHYRNEQDLYYFVNEGTSVWQGETHVPVSGGCCLYDAWENRILPAEYETASQGTTLRLTDEPRKSVIVLFGRTADETGKIGQETRMENTRPRGADVGLAGTDAGLTGTDTGIRQMLTHFKRSRCSAVNYPAFTDSRETTLPDATTKADRKFSGFVRYETGIEWKPGAGTTLVITGEVYLE